MPELATTAEIITYAVGGFVTGLVIGCAVNFVRIYRLHKQRSRQREFNFHAEVDTERRKQSARW